MPTDTERKRKAWNVAFGNLFFRPDGGPATPRTYSRLRIPEFQRNFVWQKDQLKEFVTSVKENEAGYYVGNIVIVEGEEGYGDIVDGQQRLVTLSLICRAMMSCVTDEDLRAKAKKMCCVEDDMSVPRILFSREILARAYRELIEHDTFESRDNSQQKLINASNFIKALLVDEREFPTEESRRTFLEKILALEFVVIACVTESDAYQLFEGLNSTGLSLAPVELVKNAILGNIKRLDATATPRAVEIWESMEKAFDGSGSKVWFGKFIRHQWFGIGGYVNNPDLFKKINDSKIKRRTLVEIQDYLELLNRDATLYLALRTANIPASDEIFSEGSSDSTRSEVPRLTHHFKTLGLDQVYSLLLALLKYSRSTPEYSRRDMMVRHFRWLLKFSIIVKYSGISPASYERIFSRACFEILGKDYRGFRTYMASIFAELKALLPKESFVTEFSKKYENDPGTQGVTKFILFQLCDVPLNFSAFTVEHVVPEGADWSNWGHIGPEFVDLTRQNVQRIGNLSLLEAGINERCNALGFEQKAAEYAHSTYLPIQSIDAEYREVFVSQNPSEAIEARSSQIASAFFNTLQDP